MPSCTPSTLPPAVTYAISNWEGTKCVIVGNYRGTAHSRCNLAYRISKSEWKLPVIRHNLQGYDGHLIVKALKSGFGEVGVIPQNMEKYVDRLKFIDSLQFVPQSLDSLAKTLEVDELKYVREEFPIQHEFKLIKRKGVYPWDYMDNFARFDESRLPSQDASFSKLSDGPCSDTEYAHATQLWTAFECESMADYHDMADFFETFRAICLAHYSLDSVHCYTAAGLAWDEALKMPRVLLELITDIDMYHFIEKCIRGGISMITTRYAQVNSPTLPGYNASRPRVQLIYLDANNLYRWAVSQPLPTGGFQFLQPDKIEALALAGELSDDAKDDNDALFRTATAGAGKMVLSKLAWVVSIVQPNDVLKVNLYKSIAANNTIPVGFRRRQCETFTLPQSRSTVWRLGVSSPPEKPRWVVVVLQTGNSGNQERNAALEKYTHATIYV